MIYFDSATSSLPSLEETQALAQEVQTDLQQLKPNVVLDTVQGWVPGLLSFSYRAAIAVLIFLIGTRIASLVRSFLRRTFTHMNMDLSLSKFLLSLCDAAIYAVVLFMALEKIGIPSSSIIALLGSTLLAIGISLQGSLANFAGGILILLMRPFGVHDYIISEGVEGTVQNIGLVYTTLLTIDNKKITIPNGSLSNSIITNVTIQEKRRLDLTVGIGYTSDLRRAKAILEELYRSNPLVLAQEDITVFVQALGDSAVVLEARGWVRTEDYWPVRWQITEGIKLAFDEAGIEIPYNQLDVHVKERTS